MTDAWTPRELEAHARHHFEMAQGYGSADEASRYWRNAHMGQCLWAISGLNRIAPTGLTPFVSTTADYAAWFARRREIAA